MDFPLQNPLFLLIGGLGIYLFGIQYMGDGLQKASGGRLRWILDRYTSNPFLAVIAGMAVTILLQSSSGTIILTAGLVSTGVLSLRQAAAIILGTNLGTTLFAFIIGLDAGEYALLASAAGSLLLFFFKNKVVTRIGQTFFGFGSVLLGLSIMGNGMAGMAAFSWIKHLLYSMGSSPLLGVICGALFTAVIQSSTAAVGIFQELHAEGLFTLRESLPILLGNSLGSAAVVLLASIGTSVHTRRTAWIYMLFNTAAVLILICLFLPFVRVVERLSEMLHLKAPMDLALAHGLYSLFSLVVLLPLTPVFTKLVRGMIRSSHPAQERRGSHLDPMFIEQSPAVALGQAKEEILRMGNLAVRGLYEARSYLFTKRKEHAETACRIEETINRLNHEIVEYLVQISSVSMLPRESVKSSVLMDAARDIERVGDHVENLIELADYSISHKVVFSELVEEELKEFFLLVLFSLEHAVTAFDHHDLELAGKVIQNEEAVDHLERSLRTKHILRMKQGLCSGQEGIIYTDILTNLERIGDHAVNLAEAARGLRP